MMLARSIFRIWSMALGLTVVVGTSLAARAEGVGMADSIGQGRVGASWEIASQKRRGGLDIAVYVEAKKTPGSPGFRIETRFEVPPFVAAAVLMGDMLTSDEPTTSGETRRVLERFDQGALVHTRIDLPLMFSDREIAIRIVHTIDEKTGIHRIDWVDVNEVLPPVEDGVLRLATQGYWEFRPDAPRGTQATYMSRAEVGGSLPASLGNRLMKGQAVTAVERLGGLIAERRLTHVSGPPPIPPPAADLEAD
jgi:hypothetical protein